MSHDLDAIFDEQRGVATSGQLLRVWTRSQVDTRIARGDLLKVWPGIYCRDEPDDALRLSGLDLRAGEPVAICLGTAAAAYGFDTEQPADLHVLNPVRHHLRSSDGLVVHRRIGAPLGEVGGRPATTPEWTAIEVARGVRRPRALATLDLALRSGSCDGLGLLRAADRQAGRRGIAAVRELIPLAAPEAESPMESEARLMMIDGGLPRPELQFEVTDHGGRLWRLDFAWPDQKVAVEYDGFDFHADPEALRHDRQKRAAFDEMRWRVMSIVSDDVRRRSWETVRRIDIELDRAKAAA